MDFFSQPDPIEAARERRDTALVQVEEHADDDWLERAFDALIIYLLHHQTMFVDDYWAVTGLDKPREPRALGAVFTRAARQKFMEKNGEYRPSVASNLTPKPVWRSLICKPGSP